MLFEMTGVERSPIRVVGRYALYNEIAAGGMASIHLGRLLGPVGFARTVAVKRLHPQYAKDPEFVSMFLDEARLAARVQHPNVVATIDVVATDGELFLIMDYVRGESLSKILRTLHRRGERVPPRIAAAIMCGFLHGLHAAHEAKNERGEPLNLVHRDVSPQNVLVGSDGIARVLDFGIAKAQGRIQITRDGQIKGKLAYMPPEQLTGRALTRAADIYASAIVMWETLTTERLFKRDTDTETLEKILHGQVTPPSALASSLKAFDAPLLKALSRDPGKRYATAKELALTLERCAGIATPTEVGEWVEKIVGPVLHAREEEIAAIESSSVTAQPVVHSPDSDSDFATSSLPTARPETSTTDTSMTGSRPPQVESTATKSRLVTGTMPGLPLDRKLPILASIAGVIVLGVVLTVIITGKLSGDDGRHAAAPAPTPTTADPVWPKTADDHAVPSPVPPNTSSPAATPAPSEAGDDEPPPSDEKRSEAKVPASADDVSLPSRPKPVVQNSHPPPKPTTVKSSTPLRGGAQSCDPPYTVDAQGRKKYKLECM